MDWFVGLVLVGALIYWFFSKEPEEPPTPDKYQEKPRVQHKFERRHNIKPEAVEKRNISGPVRATNNTPVGKQILEFKSDSLKDLLCKMAIAGRHEYDKPNAYIHVHVGGEHIGINAATFSSALACYKPMLKEGNALLARARRLKPGSKKTPEIIAKMEQMMKEIRPHTGDILQAMDIISTDSDKAFDRMDDLDSRICDLHSELEWIAKSLRNDEW